MCSDVKFSVRLRLLGYLTEKLLVNFFVYVNQRLHYHSCDTVYSVLPFLLNWGLLNDNHLPNTSFVFAEEMADHAPSVAMEAVLKPSCDLPEDMPKIKGYDFNQGVDHQALLKSYLTTGFQASRFGLAVQEINNMVS